MVVALLILAAPATARETLGVYKSWGAMRDAPTHCFAIARPVAAGRRAGGYASVGNWPGRGLRSSLSLRLGRPRDVALPVTLTVGERRFALVGTANEAWAADAPSDRAIVTAMRSGRSMSIEAVGVGGRPFADVYALAGAATAIDAAALGASGGERRPRRDRARRGRRGADVCRRRGAARAAGIGDRPPM